MLGWTLWDQVLTEEIARSAHWERSAVDDPVPFARTDLHLTESS